MESGEEAELASKIFETLIALDATLDNVGGVLGNSQPSNAGALGFPLSTGAPT